jgi:hypothetical protein
MTFQFENARLLTVLLSPYTGEVKARPEPRVHARVTVVAYEAPDDESPAGASVEMEFPSVKAAREFLETALDMLTGSEKFQQEIAQDRATHAVRCPHCKGWVDTRDPARAHGNGEGLTCLVDGTFLTRETFEGQEGDLVRLEAGLYVVVETARDYFDPAEGFAERALRVRPPWRLA